MNFLKLLHGKRSLTHKLIVYLLGVGLLSTTIIGTFAYHQSKKELLNQSFEKLKAVRKIKENQIEHFFEARNQELRFFAQHPDTRQSLGAYQQTFENYGLQSAAYDSVQQIFHSSLREIQTTYGYHDLFLITKEGTIVYSAEHEADFGTNLLSGTYRNSNLAKVFKAAQGKASITDFELYAPSNNAPASFIAAPIYNQQQQLQGVLALQISLHAIDEIMQERSGMGESGETYLVGSDKLMRSDSRFSDTTTVLTQKIDTEAVRKALNGQSGSELMTDYRGQEVLSSFSPIDIQGLNWVIISEIDLQEVLQPIKSMRNWLTVFSLLLAVLIVVAAIIISRRFTRPINTIREAVLELGQGEVPEDVKIKTGDEIEQMGQALNTLTHNIKNMTSFAQKIGKGEFKTSFQPMSEKDVMGQALLNMRDELRQVEEAAEKRRWINQGSTRINNLLKSHKENIEECSQVILKELIEYCQANQGTLYLINDENPADIHMELKACYAWAKPKYRQHRIEKGAGLIGQCWIEQEEVFLKEVPQNYIAITSGLGKALPRCIFICPLIINEKVFGVIEIAAFHELEEHQRNFIKNIGEDIASALSGTKIFEQTNKLLQQVQQQTEELKAQEEEVRQNMEELSATQEEMERQKKEMEQEIISLRHQLSGNPTERE